MQMTTSELKQAFITQYGEGDVTGFFSPGRVNLIGEHTDYNGGFVFPCALSFGNYCFARKTNTNKFRFASVNMDSKWELEASQLTAPLEDRVWVNYPVGVMAQFLKRGLKLGEGIDFLFYGDVPDGAGLSSSAALEVVTAVAINDLFDFNIDRITLTQMCQKAEHDFAGVNCGIMDQFASGLGKKDHAIFLNCDTLTYDHVPVILDGYKIIVSNTNSPHKLSSSKYNERVKECQSAVNALKPFSSLTQLGDLSWDKFISLQDNISDSTIKRRAQHVVSEIKRTTDAVDALKAGDLLKFGELMNASHDSLRHDYEVTGNELDAMVEEGRKIEGVIGTRMTGGGFGGCTVSIVKDESIDNYILQVGKTYKTRTGLTPEFYVAEIGDGGRKIEL